jgi:hypothetical protein
MNEKNSLSDFELNWLEKNKDPKLTHVLVSNNRFKRVANRLFTTINTTLRRAVVHIKKVIK